MTGETQLVELEQRKISGLAWRDLAEFTPSDTGRRALGRPAQCVLVADLGDAVARSLQQEGRPHLLHQVGSIVGGRAIDAKADADARLLHLANRTASGRQDLVRAGAVADGGSRLAQPLHLSRIEEDAMREPGTPTEPAALLEIIKRPA